MLTHSNTHIHTHTHIHTFIHTLSHTHACSHTQTCIYSHIHTQTHVCTHIFSHSHTPTHTYIHILQIRLRSRTCIKGDIKSRSDSWLSSRSSKSLQHSLFPRDTLLGHRSGGRGSSQSAGYFSVSFSWAIFVTIQYMDSAASRSVLARLRAHSLLAEALLFPRGRFHGILGPETRWEQTIQKKKKIQFQSLSINRRN